MRILHVLDHSLPLQSGYVFRTMGILREQRAMGWETLQLTSPKQNAGAGVPALSEQIGDWTFHRTPTPNGIRSKLPIADQLADVGATAGRIRDLVEAYRPDVLHAHSPVLNAMSAFRAASAGAPPVVYEVRAFWEDAALELGTTKPRSARYRATRFLETRALRQADAVIVISQGLRREIVNRGIQADKVALVPNAVDADQFANRRRADKDIAARLGIAGKSVLGFVGSLNTYEGLDLLLETLPQVLASRPAIKVLLVGDGPDAQRLRAIAERLGLGDHVTFAGSVPHDAVGDYYQHIDALVYPRKSSRLTELVTPLKPLEAMAAGRIVLASDVGGHKELIRHDETGYLFRADDREDLHRQILSVFDQQDRWPAVQDAARQFVETERSWRNVARRYVDVYAHVVK